MSESDFIAAMAAALEGLMVDGMRVVVDATRPETEPGAALLSADFHLEGPGACTAGFTCTFFSGRTIEENVADLADFVRQQNPIASTPPGAAMEQGAD